MTSVFDGGLVLSFDGQTNPGIDTVRQSFVPEAGAHRLTVEYEAEGITSDQGPFLLVTWAQGVLLQTPMIRGSEKRKTESWEFVAPAGEPLVTVQLVRSQSQKFDNKLGGTLKLYRVSVKAEAAGQARGRMMSRSISTATER